MLKKTLDILSPCGDSLFHSVILHIGFQIWISFYLILVSRSVSLHIRISSFSNILSNIFIYSIDCVNCITHVESCKLISQIFIQLFLAIMTQSVHMMSVVDLCSWEGASLFFVTDIHWSLALLYLHNPLLCKQRFYCHFKWIWLGMPVLA